MPRFPYEHHFLVCTGKRCNADARGEAIRAELKETNKALGRKATVRVCAVSCLDLCDYGPNMVVWPEGDVYHALDPEKAKAIYRRVMGDDEEPV
ncbi:MAG TPA: (2Fe-2S) ferredoxin domain-containing protein [Thermoanaerobaculia bacterium]